MTWRVIVRMSFDNDKGSRLRYRAEKCLAECGIKFSKSTGTWEGSDVTPAEAAKQFRIVFALLSDPNQIAGVRRARLDHLWIYIDRARVKSATPPGA
jgi:hypothetical protein